MTNLKEDIQSEDASKHHTSWLHSILDNIQELDHDFPLSGGEHEHPYVVYKHEARTDKENTTQPAQASNTDNTEPKEHTSWFDNILERIQDLDTDCPLSGGEHSHS